MSIHQQLMQLFLLEKQVRGLRSRLDQAARRVKVISVRMEDLRRQLAGLDQQQKQTRAVASQFEGEAKDMELRETRLREQMNSVKTNKEYQAMLVEVNTLKIERGKVEEKALTQLTKVDELASLIAEIKAKIDEQLVLLNSANSELAASDAEVRERLDAVTAEHVEACGLIPAELLKTFRRLAEAYDGEVMASVEEVNRRRREYNCGGCFMQIPLERVNVLLSGSEQIATCPSCGRLLYVGDALKIKDEAPAR